MRRRLDGADGGLGVAAARKADRFGCVSAGLPPPPALAPEALSGDAEDVARTLLGCRLLSYVGGVVTGGRIVETEAYVGRHDPACHAAVSAGQTARNAPMWGPPATAYVYFIYGMHWCFNVVTGRSGDPQAVLIRALEPEVGAGAMQVRRGRSQDLTNGPARLCEALGIDGSLNEHSLTSPPLIVAPGCPEPSDRIGVSGRIGIRKARDWPLRFFLEGHRDVSTTPPAIALRSLPSR